MMRKLYYEDSHKKEFEAFVTSCTIDPKSGSYQVTLDQTAFFPEGGGQLSDQGTLLFYKEGQERSAFVSDVHIKENHIIHTVSAEIPEGSRVTGILDWERRFDFMQQHSGEHIFSGLVHQHFGADNVGFHLGLSEVTLDFNINLTMEQLREMELLANAAIWKNLPVKSSFPSPASLKELDYRSKLELTEDVRIVTIPGYDVCACCAPHVTTTGEIGALRVTGAVSHRGGVRVTILCGKRALFDYRKKQDNILAISSLLSARQEETAAAVERVKAEVLSLKEEGNLLQTKLLLEKRKALPLPQVTDHIYLFTEPMNEIAIRNAVNEMTLEYKGYVLVFWGEDTSGYRFLAGSQTLDCREFQKDMKHHFEIKGGGKPQMVQGTVIGTKEALENYLLNYIKGEK